MDLLDAYEQICILPEDMHKMVFAMIYGMFISNIMQQGNCNTHTLNISASNEVNILWIHWNIFAPILRWLIHLQQLSARAPETPRTGG